MWGDHQTTKDRYLESDPTASCINTQDPANIALNISRHLIDVVKFKSILHIEAGLEMIVLAMTISSEVCNIRLFQTI